MFLNLSFLVNFSFRRFLYVNFWIMLFVIVCLVCLWCFLKFEVLLFELVECEGFWIGVFNLFLVCILFKLVFFMLSLSFFIILLFKMFSFCLKVREFLEVLCDCVLILWLERVIGFIVLLNVFLLLGLFKIVVFKVLCFFLMFFLMRWSVLEINMVLKRIGFGLVKFFCSL